MVTGPAPERLGIGIARGTATRLVSEGIVLDYTGRCLNLAARLMDKARPNGVVFHDGYASELMDETIATSFLSDTAWIRGISEQKPLPIYKTESVLIRPADREPTHESEYQYGEPTYLTVADVRRLTSFGFHLPHAPQKYQQAGVFVQYPSYDTEARDTGYVSSFTIEEGQIEEHPDSFVMYISLEGVKAAIKNLPTSTKFLVWDSNTKVTFIPYCRAKSGKRKPNK